MSKKLAAKAGLIGTLVVPTPAPIVGPDAEAARPRTAPGSMLQFMSSQSAAIKEADELRERVRELETSAPVRLLDPACIRPSRWANRHEDSFANADFELLKAEIESAGGNVQPIRVRPVAPIDQGVLNGSTPSPAPAYELVFGHRRHRACLELGIPVLALIEEANDQELFVAMERENRARKNLSAWEQGCMYRRALDDGLYPSLRKLAEAIQVDVSLVSKSVALARLPQTVVQAFASPLEIQFRWAQPLGEALQKDPEGVVARARALIDAGQKLPSAQVFKRLITVDAAPEPGVLNGSTPLPVESQTIGKSAKRRATMHTDEAGAVHLSFAPGAVPQARHQELVALIEAFLKG